ncbi:hypothetical protein [Poseidonibacter ostreae]|uniref:Uncharacterized protein n=1 Tax=Poseidonibacter ostreae TaxID=2654171 RepID=A0A6L4WVB3_9BACT|nr:hypothetical protein [Poseidonibacter ostreae]KAB7888872.1 hypothetical protein GBG18_12210 [Poseidonibacter ostreae]KAB7889637.1 hypothetical protein GBG19_05360 [Poseidonibacter ostreae]
MGEKDSILFNQNGKNSTQIGTQINIGEPRTPIKTLIFYTFFFKILFLYLILVPISYLLLNINKMQYISIVILLGVITIQFMLLKSQKYIHLYQNFCIINGSILPYNNIKIKQKGNSIILTHERPDIPKVIDFIFKKDVENFMSFYQNYFIDLKYTTLKPVREEASTA